MRALILSAALALLACEGLRNDRDSALQRDSTLQREMDLYESMVAGADRACRRSCASVEYGDPYFACYSSCLRARDAGM